MPQTADVTELKWLW